MWQLDEGIAEPITPSEWGGYLLESGTLHQLTDAVRSVRASLRAERDPAARRALGQELYDLQQALKARFGVDIAKVR